MLKSAPPCDHADNVLRSPVAYGTSPPWRDVYMWVVGSVSCGVGVLPNTGHKPPVGFGRASLGFPECMQGRQQGHPPVKQPAGDVVCR